METHETRGDYWRLMRLKELLGTHETLDTNKDSKGIMRLIETAGIS